MASGKAEYSKWLTGSGKRFTPMLLGSKNNFDCGFVDEPNFFNLTKILW